MDLRNWMQTSRSFAIFFTAVLLIILAATITLVVIVGRNTYLNMRLSTICPDYFSYEYAYVVDERGRGLDSAAVALRDNSNINMIYRTFTDHNGRFVLFHDFGSFALSKIPFSYFLYVSVEGWNDTIQYTFEKYRACHFRKKDGPDTIVCDRGARSKLILRLGQAARITVDTGYGFIPFEEIALSERLPGGVAAKLPFDKVFYTTIPAGGSSIAFAVVPVRDYRVLEGEGLLLTEGIYYYLDRDGNRDLGNEQPQPFAGPGESGGAGIADCTVRTCRTIDSVRIGSTWCLLDLQLRSMDRRQPLLRFRRNDALLGTVVLKSAGNAVDIAGAAPAGPAGEAVVDSAKYKIFLWDHRGLNYSDRSAVVLGIDRNNDGKFDSREGSGELYEHARGRIALGGMSFVIDTIAPDGLRLFCSDIKQGEEKPAEAMTGKWVNDFTASATCPVSLYRECGAHRYVVLYFFEGTAADFMEAPEIGSFISLMRGQLGPTRIIGINRRPTGELYGKEPVINENRGWHGPLVRRFHNHRTEEIVCLDAAATIVYRGEVDAGAISAVWKHAGVDDAVAVSLFEQQYAGREVGLPAR
ncbi:MAG: hypothetical protein JW913_18700 [Chitinispirillaceae bacterium]|nr:hypothetical protein [Chitinispirillaceae bacterium]